MTNPIQPNHRLQQVSIHHPWLREDRIRDLDRHFRFHPAAQEVLWCPWLRQRSWSATFPTPSSALPVCRLTDRCWLAVELRVPSLTWPEKEVSNQRAKSPGSNPVRWSNAIRRQVRSSVSFERNLWRFVAAAADSSLASRVLLGVPGSSQACLGPAIERGGRRRRRGSGPTRWPDPFRRCFGTIRTSSFATRPRRRSCPSNLLSRPPWRKCWRRRSPSRRPRRCNLKKKQLKIKKLKYLETFCYLLLIFWLQSIGNFSSNIITQLIRRKILN